MTSCTFTTIIRIRYITYYTKTGTNKQGGNIVIKRAQRKAPIELGRQIKLKLVEKNMTLRGLGKKIGMSQQNISDVIYGRNTSEKTIKKILDGLRDCV